MGNSASPALLKAWLSWLRSGFLLKLVGLPAAVLALHLELYGSSRRYSLILHRLLLSSRSLRTARLPAPPAKTRSQRALSSGHAPGLNANYLSSAHVMERVHHSRSPSTSSRKQSAPPDNRERARPLSYPISRVSHITTVSTAPRDSLRYSLVSTVIAIPSGLASPVAAAVSPAFAAGPGPAIVATPPSASASASQPPFAHSSSSLSHISPISSISTAPLQTLTLAPPVVTATIPDVRPTPPATQSANAVSAPSTTTSTISTVPLATSTPTPTLSPTSPVPIAASPVVLPSSPSTLTASQPAPAFSTVRSIATASRETSVPASPVAAAVTPAEPLPADQPASAVSTVFTAATPPREISPPGSPIVTFASPAADRLPVTFEPASPAVSSVSDVATPSREISAPPSPATIIASPSIRPALAVLQPLRSLAAASVNSTAPQDPTSLRNISTPRKALFITPGDAHATPAARRFPVTPQSAPAVSTVYNFSTVPQEHEIFDARPTSPAPSSIASSAPSSARSSIAACPPTPASAVTVASSVVSASPATPAAARFPKTPISMHAHSRSKSHADAARSNKRLSLQFPIQPTATGSSSPALPTPRSRPQSWMAAPSPVPSPEAPSPEPNILSVIAAQERFVLELKEELSKAESDLKMLKKHYATQEATKVRNDLRKVTKLQPLNTSLANFGSDPDDQDGSNLWMHKEMERRKALLSAKSAQRGKVFSGSRHLRALSLLSPDKSYTPSFPQPLDVLNDEPPTPASAPAINPYRSLGLARSNTSPDIANQIADSANPDRYDLTGLSNIQREALVRTGKQMATDFKDGFLTFIEDIRQATVGDDAFAADASSAVDAPAKSQRKASENRPTLNRAASSKNSAAGKKKMDIGDEFWKEHGLSEPKAEPTNKKTHGLKHAHTPQKPAQSKDDDFDSWDNWETPVDKTAHTGKVQGEAASSDESEAPSSPVSGKASSRTSTRYHSQRHDSKASTLTADSSVGIPEDFVPRDSKRSSIPWPELTKLSPGNLKRTASHLMKEWEKNLTPPPESRDFNHGSGDYIGRAVSPSDFA